MTSASAAIACGFPARPLAEPVENAQRVGNQEPPPRAADWRRIPTGGTAPARAAGGSRDEPRGRSASGSRRVLHRRADRPADVAAVEAVRSLAASGRACPRSRHAQPLVGLEWPLVLRRSACPPAPREGIGSRIRWRNPCCVLTSRPLAGQPAPAQARSAQPRACVRTLHAPRRGPPPRRARHTRPADEKDLLACQARTRRRPLHPCPSAPWKLTTWDGDEESSSRSVSVRRAVDEHEAARPRPGQRALGNP